MKNKFKALWAKKWLRRVVYLGIVIIIGFLLFGRSKKVEYETLSVSRGTVTETVVVTGQVKPKSSASLRFKTTGTIAAMNVDSGAKVFAGQTLANLDFSELSKKVTQAQAEVVTTQVAVDNSTQEVADTGVKNTQTLTLLYADAPGTLSDILNLTQQSYASLVSFYDTTGRLLPAIANPILDSQLVVYANNGKELADAAMKVVRSAIQNFSAGASNADIDTAYAAIHQPLQNIKNGLNSLVNAVASIPNGAMNAATLQEYKDTLATAQSNLNSAIAKETTTSAGIADAKIQSRLNLNTTNATQRTASANLEKAQATLAIARQSLSDAYLRAPFAGVIATRSKQIGELVTSSDQVFYLLGDGGLEIVANVPEVDIAKLMLNDKTEITLDAYGNDIIFPATVSQIDPAETFIDGVATYKVTFTLAGQDTRIRSGMTAYVSVTTEQRENALSVPQRAVTASGVNRIIRVLVGEKAEEVHITTGLRGNKGEVEVIGGLTEGQTVIVGTK